MNAHFRHLIEGLCRLCGRNEPGRVLDGGAVVVDGVAFSLMHDEERNPELLFIYCDFGEVRPGRQADVYRALLEANRFLYNGSGPAYGVSHETGRIVLADRFPAGVKGSAEELHATLVRLAARAVEWRAGNFLKNGVP